MEEIMKKVAKFAAVALVVALLAGCSRTENDSTISIMFQGANNEQAAIRDSTARFTAATGIEVRLLYTPHDSYTARLAGYIRSGDVPDIISVDGPNLAYFAWAGVIQSLEEYLDQDVIDDMTPSNVEQCTYPIDNKLYAIGAGDSTVLLFANKTYLEKIGARIPTSVADSWTIDEFDNILDRLAALDEVTWPLDIMWATNLAGSEWGTYGFYEAFVSAGTDIIDRNTWTATGTLNSATAANVMRYFQRWAQAGYIVPKSAGTNTLYDDRRQTAIAWNGNWGYEVSHANMGDDVIALPLPNFGNGTRSPNATWIWAISSATKQPERAGQLLSFMMKDTQFLDDCEANGAFPALRSFAARCEDYMDPNRMAIAFEQADVAVARPMHPAYPTITIAFADAFESILNGADIQTELDKAAAMIDEDIRDSDGYPPFGSVN